MRSLKIARTVLLVIPLALILIAIKGWPTEAEIEEFDLPRGKKGY